MASERWTLDDVAAYYARQGLKAPPGQDVPGEAPRPPADSEKAFLAWIRRLARDHGWLTYHTHRSDRSEPGFPDLVLVRECIIFAEVKTNSGKLTQEQHTWLSVLEQASARVDAVVWRPRDRALIAARLTARQSAAAV